MEIMAHDPLDNLHQLADGSWVIAVPYDGGYFDGENLYDVYPSIEELASRPARRRGRTGLSVSSAAGQCQDSTGTRAAGAR